MKIKTNNHIRYAKYYPHDMTEKECKQVESVYGGLIELHFEPFVFYCGHPYYMGDCMRLSYNSTFREKGFHGYFDDSAFSIILVKEVQDDNFENGYVFAIAFS